MRTVIIIILTVILLAVSFQIFLIFREKNQLKNKLEDLNGRLKALVEKNAELRAEIEFFAHPENLEKELRARFNYKKPEEKMIIIVP